MWFDPQQAWIRHVRCGTHEVVRAIYAAVRDAQWQTLTPCVKELRIDARAESFHLSFEVDCQQESIDFGWHGDITGDVRGCVTYTFEGRARSRFLTNRMGLCVLHPVEECAGKPCLIENTDGHRTHAVFSHFISPHQPARRIRAISYAIDADTWVDLRFDGDEFEMEDQRNWTDDSFKTYSPPLDRPHPVIVEPGTRIEHRVHLELAGQPIRASKISIDEPPVLSMLDPVVKPMPRLGLGFASHGIPLTGKQVSRLQALALDHGRVDLNLGTARWQNRLLQATQEARALGIGLHVALHLGDNASAALVDLAKVVNQLDSPVKLWLIYHQSEEVTSDPWVRRAVSHLSNHSSSAFFAAGTNLHFAELNRHRPSYGPSILPCFSMNPQVHAFDNVTLSENLAAQSRTVETLRQFNRQPAVVSPITLRPRPAMGTEGLGAGAPENLPAHMDVRQLSLFGAGWTLGSLAGLSGTGGVHSLTYYEMTGCLGVMEREAGSVDPQTFPSSPGSVFPVYHVFADLANCPSIVPLRNSHPRQIQGMAAIDGEGRRRILMSNLSDRPQPVHLRANASIARVRYLDESSVGQSQREPEEYRRQTAVAIPVVAQCLPVLLSPFALARVDLE
ncbi:MAG TPA: hypothetical protein P5186_00425 [Candidatus Paceibacterota bacterium]|nr:hypothetical protein [Verrucomicrobiota bacterium]HRY46486.1 hypothetical protein [Candidatus Paceibacterota bacterium]